MYITPVSLPFGSKGLKLRISHSSEINKNNLYLYNKTMNIINQYGLPAEITNTSIILEFSEPRFQSDLIRNTKKTMKKSGIFYEKVK